MLSTSMPHAVAVDRPFDNLIHRSKHDSLLLPLPKSSAIPPLRQLSQYSRPSAIPTPPASMQLTSNNILPPYHQANGSIQSDNPWGSGRSSTQGVGGQALLSTGNVHSLPGSRHTSPSQRSSYAASESSHRRKISNNAISPQLRIPSSINTPQLGMPQLAAEITCLFWFENSSTLMEVLRPTSPRKRPSPLVPEAIPSTGFRKWVATILSTTQVAQNVVLLALLFVYRLKKTNPTVKGKLGSEYRLLTVALMLGNKFLDDNTYTNKTWAEVSGISVQEVHIMEVEFLSNMRYSLFTSEEEWNEWHVILGQFGTYFDRASRANMELAPKPSAPATPSLLIPPTLPSPPTSTRASPPFTTSPGHANYSHTPHLLPQASSTAVSPIGPLPELNYHPNGRKRSYDEAAQGPPPKRPLHQYPPLTAPGVTSSSHIPIATPATTLPRLPNLSVPLTQPSQHHSQAPPQLPPPGNRAMSLVYPPPTQWEPTSRPASGPALPQIHPPSVPMHDQSRQHSPFPNSAAASPTAMGYPNQNRRSPSFFLQQRQSPYRPVRHVQTLLYPPPSASMHNPFKNVSFEYQPLGRPTTERRAGLVPYMHHEAWPETNQLNQWPVLPQPNFSRG